jgi:MoxR-like ATPase
VTGFSIYDQRSGEFVFHPGPVLSNVLLADEINRTIPRTQSSLLESMGEFQVTVDGRTLTLPRPFFVIATQNPIEMDGTFPLPEAQLDRFLMKIDLGYPSKTEELAILDRFGGGDPIEALVAVTTPDVIVANQRLRAAILVAPPVRDYIADLVIATRAHSRVRYGASPRASLGLLRAVQALAMLRDREYAVPDDVKELALPVLAHRVILRHEERAKGSTARLVLEEILARLPVPSPV